MKEKFLALIKKNFESEIKEFLLEEGICMQSCTFKLYASLNFNYIVEDMMRETRKRFSFNNWELLLNVLIEFRGVKGAGFKLKAWRN